MPLSWYTAVGASLATVDLLTCVSGEKRWLSYVRPWLSHSALAGFSRSAGATVRWARADPLKASESTKSRFIGRIRGRVSALSGDRINDDLELRSIAVQSRP